MGRGTDFFGRGRSSSGSAGPRQGMRSVGTGPFGADVVIEGGAEIDKALATLSSFAKQQQIQGRAIRTALRPVRKESRTQVRQNLDTMNAQDRALMSKKIYITPVKKYKRTGTQLAKVTVRSEKVTSASGRMVNFAPLLHIFELGAAPHIIRQKHRTIHHPGIPARPLLTKSLDMTRGVAEALFVSTVWKWVRKEWAK